MNNSFGVKILQGKLALLYIALAAMLWGTTGTSQAFAPQAAHPLTVGAIRLIIGGLFLFFISIMTGKLKIKAGSFKILLGAALCMALYQPLFFSAVSMTGVAVGTVVTIGSAPILSGFIEWFFLKNKPTFLWWIATLIAILGCLLLFACGESMSIHPVGVAFGTLAGLTFAVYTMVSKKVASEQDPISLVAIIFTLSAIFLTPILFFYDISWIVERRGMLVSLHLGIVATGIAYVLFAKGLVQTKFSLAVTFALIEPLTATFLGVFLLGEKLELTSFMGITLLLTGIGILIFASGRDGEK